VSEQFGATKYSIKFSTDKMYGSYRTIEYVLKTDVFQSDVSDHKNIVTEIRHNEVNVLCCALLFDAMNYYERMT
jgi:hypothetical protein